MAKSSSLFVCQQCGYQSPTFLGKCPECGSWGSLVEQISNPKNQKVKKAVLQPGSITYTKDIEQQKYPRLVTKLEEFNRVLGGGIVVGSLILVSGDPGIGKSTLLTQVALEFNQLTNGNWTLYVAGEESAQQIKIRAERIEASSNLPVLNETDVDIIISTIEQLKPNLVVVDSIQTLATQDLESAAGSVSQVRECARRLQETAKKLHIPTILVGHVTKEGMVAGPRTLEHLVDVVLSLEGDPGNTLRVLRTTKNRFGSTDEVGVFDMSESGMVEVKNPSEAFLEEKVNAPGSAVVSTINGLRPILVEVQALVTKSNLSIPRRVGTGVDNNRLQLLVAVISKRLNFPLYEMDIFVNVTGGLKVLETAADLGICMAIISSFKDKSLDPKTAFVGEVGLLGELRKVRNLDKRVNEAKKLGYNKIVSSETVKSLKEAGKLV